MHGNQGQRQNRQDAAAEQALRMLDSFARVGADRFDVTFTNILETKTGFLRSRTVPSMRYNLPGWVNRSGTLAPITLPATEKEPEKTILAGENLIMRPHSPPPVFLVQLDDLELNQLERVQPVAFLTLATSPGNHQAWVAVEQGSTELARRLRKGAGADLSASGATRVAGTLNFKGKYAPEFPTITIRDAQPGRTVSVAQLDAMGLLAPPDPARVPLRVSGNRRARGKWPSYEVCLQGAPLAHNSDRPDISRADFTWCMVAIDWGHGIEETADRLMELSTKARENGEQYALLTAQRAAAAQQRRPLERPR